jgi:hypothetical protein
MTTGFVIAVSVMAIALVLWNAGVVRRFQSDYRYDGEFHGQRYECILTFANSEYGTRCSLGADESALYLLAVPKRKVSWWKNRAAHSFFRANLQIPWSDLDWREKRIVFKDCIWFEIPAKRIYFYVARDVGDKLLIEAGRKIQSEFAANSVANV